ncbi:SfnB family sulfur acquisition oxidoreductase [Vreelandella nigrificans]|uniref:SfnB family sulfur acquisition oxidoreductase n=1 Tax=Vreelandella nigrificans TaxID=2042704 RepID=A0A2A4HNA1_9GAMM|nr:SfnB family sulfur acquisition oxidoreductase [Halomonas nigrificans]PCF95583.1 SfnB family sulfur acquisition oxidoreductase [Halomonas nigrificans]
MNSSVDIKESREKVNSGLPFRALPLPDKQANVIKSDDEAIEIAEQLARKFSVDASTRDANGYLPIEELDDYSSSGLWGITVPKKYGGAGVSYATVAKVIRIIAEGDSSIAQITQNHIALTAHIFLDASESQKETLFDLVLKGYRFGNALSEKSSKNVAAFETKIKQDGNDYVIDGKKFYTTGALLAHIVPIVAVNGEGKLFIAFADRDSDGLTVLNDWSGIGQRTTASGTTLIEGVRVPAYRVIPVESFSRPTAAGAISQIVQAAIDAGIASAAIQDTIYFIRYNSRAWIDSGKEAASEDMLTINLLGDLVVKLHAAEALLERAGKAIDIAVSSPSEETVNEATIATSESKVLTTQVAIEATNKLFELAGARSALEEHNFDRHWRNARVHTLHDPIRWKFFHIGNYYLNGVHAPRHPWN